MKKIFPAAITIAALLGSGCIIVPRSRAAAPRQGSAVDHSAPERCPPGHLWRDGRCHETGREHDRDRDHQRR
jgi:hypothetical protein